MHIILCQLLMNYDDTMVASQMTNKVHNLISLNVLEIWFLKWWRFSSLLFISWFLTRCTRRYIFIKVLYSCWVVKDTDEEKLTLWLFLKAQYFLKNCSMYFFFTYLFYLWLCWVVVSVRGLSLVAASGGHSSSPCAGLSLSRPLLLWSTGSRRAGSTVVAHGPSCSAACGIFPDQGSNPCPLHWQADSQPLCHQGSPWRSPF